MKPCACLGEEGRPPVVMNNGGGQYGRTEGWKDEQECAMRKSRKGFPSFPGKPRRAQAEEGLSRSLPPHCFCFSVK
jgi:hypothetical protein